MRVKLFGFIAMVAFWCLFASADSDTDIIYWDDVERLSWDDFEAAPRMDIEEIYALTSSGIIDYKGCENGIIKYKFRAYFEKLRKLLSELEFKCGQEKDFERFVSATLENWYNEQRNYDIMTRHSLNTEMQREWHYRIKMELSLLENYAEE